MTQQEGDLTPSKFRRMLSRGSRSGSLYVFGFTAVGSAIRLTGSHSEAWLLWLNIVLLTVGVVGFVAAALELTEFGRTS